MKIPQAEPTALLDCRVPQPGREAEDYGVPQFIVEACAVLYRHRNVLPDVCIETIDEAILRLLRPWFREERDCG